MKAAILYGPRHVRFAERDAPTILEPTDAVIRLSALTLPLEQVAEGYRAMDERRAIKTLLRP
jgi:threonine dehydrogenase-like Zn-dependent dehydrogenase